MHKELVVKHINNQEKYCYLSSVGTLYVITQWI